MDGLDITTVVLFLVVFLFACYFVSWRKTLPPGPRGWPIIGNLLEFKGSRGKLPELLCKYASKYGNVFLLKYGGISVIAVNGLDSINEVLVKRKDIFSDRPDFLQYISEIGTGVILSNKQKWKDMRRMAMHALRDFGMGKQTIEEKILEEVNVIGRILSAQGEKPVAMKKYLAMATSNIICSIIFGSRFEYEDSKYQRMIQLLTAVFSRPGMFQICNAFPILRFIPSFKKGMQMNIDVYDQFDEFVVEEVKEHEISYDKDNIRDFIDLFIKFRDEEHDKSYTLKNFLRLIVDLFMAGTETTSTTLGWCLLYMMEYPDVQAKCQTEIDSVVGSGRMVTYDKRTSLPYVEATILEIQRISNIAPLSVPHAVLEETTLNGFYIPKNSIVLPNLLSVHLDPDIWLEPEVLKPERFLKDGKVFRPSAFMPFSIGPRMCAGETLAKMELFLYFTNLLQTFTFKKPEGATLTLEGFTGLTRAPRPYQLVASKR